MRKNSFLFLSSFVLWGCSKSTHHFSTLEWNGVGPTPKIDVTIDPKAKAVRDGDSEVLLAQQTIDGVPVEKSFVKKITDAKGEATFFAANYLDKSTIETLKKEIAQLRPQLGLFKKTLKATFPAVQDAKWISEPEIVIAETVFGPKAVARLDYEASNGYIYSVQMSRNLNVIQQERMGSLFDSAQALVFPEGPNKSSLMEVLLTNLVGDGTLQNTVLRITSQTPDPATVGSDHSFKFPPPDHRFDQVQVYYFVDRFLTWIRNKIGVVLPFQVNVVTHVGFPQKTNAAYYYHGEVRLGEGDDQVFSRILYDQSIVTHEFGHAIIDSLAGLPFEGEGGSINEGFADFFACSHLGSPNLGEVAYKKGPYKRTVDNSLKLSETNGGLYHDSGIVSGTLWEIRTAIGNDRGMTLAHNVLAKLTPSSTLKDLGPKFADAANSTLQGEALAKTNEILKKRGWINN